MATWILSISTAPFIPGNPQPPNAHFTWGAAPFVATKGRTCMLFTWLIGWADGNDTRVVPER